MGLDTPVILTVKNGEFNKKFIKKSPLEEYSRKTEIQWTWQFHGGIRGACNLIDSARKSYQYLIGYSFFIN